MHALIKSEAYYLMTDPVIRKWENGVTLRRQAESLRNRLQYTGRAYTRIFMLIMRESVVTVITGGNSFKLNSSFVLKSIGDFLVMQHNHAQFEKYLHKHCIMPENVV